ncbi:MAG: hypothetical protein HWD61_08735 [Parachlamydiaceae bacterium]|nr:MAG: hypothetical protein HWD61_08735 [Parachlamydiaceae bacterium]
MLVLITSYLNAETSLNLKETQPVLVAAQELQRLNSLIAITEKIWKIKSLKTVIFDLPAKTNKLFERS